MAALPKFISLPDAAKKIHASVDDLRPYKGVSISSSQAAALSLLRAVRQCWSFYWEDIRNCFQWNLRRGWRKCWMELPGGEKRITQLLGNCGIK